MTTRVTSRSLYPAVIAWFPWDLSLASRELLAIKQRMSYMDPATYISGDCFTTGDSTLQW